jgi:predicted RNA-binding protein YlqC (UPF0109 family)
MKEFLEFITKHIVDHPESVVLEHEVKEDRIVFRLKVDAADVGKVIGRNGKTATALRTLLTAVAARQGKRAILEIAD